MVGIPVGSRERELPLGCKHAKLAQNFRLAEVFTRSERSAVGPEAGQATRYIIASFLPDQLAELSYHLLIGGTLSNQILNIKGL